jgi:DNA polymerase (family 10)
MRQVPGLGAKKLRTLFLECSITSLDQLEEACRNGKVAALPGFGPKSAAKLAAGVLEVRSFHGYWRRPQAQRVAQEVVSLLSAHGEVRSVQVAGALRRELEIASELVFVVEGRFEGSRIKAELESLEEVEKAEAEGPDRMTVHFTDGVKGVVLAVTSERLGSALLEHTGPEPYVRMVRERVQGESPNEAELLRRAGLPFLPPECRDLERFWHSGAPADLVTASDLRGVLHCHSSYSDGKASLREMVEAALAGGLTYFGISDHSQSAAYAGGLSIEKVRQQHAEVDRLNEEFAGRIQVFKGIESDILPGGALDYPDDVLAGFDFVVASVHSGLDMEIDTATRRVVNAIRNPCTTILGHATGRLLLERRGFPLDWEQIVAAAREAGVVVELNANPRRLDVDWRLLPLFLDAGVRISINPDAHTPAGILDMQHGVAVARKAGTQPSQVLNCLEVGELARYFKESRA